MNHTNKKAKVPSHTGRVSSIVGTQEGQHDPFRTRTNGTLESRINDGC